jgi:ACT domain-containing protein
VKKVIRSEDIAAGARDGAFVVGRGMVITPMARDFAEAQGIRLVFPGEGGGGTGDEARLVEAVAERVAKELSRRVPDQAPGPGPARPGSRERAVITATGLNRPGVVAALTKVLAEGGADIADISQTIVAGYFTMIIVCDFDTSGGTTFRAFKDRVEEAAGRIGCGVLVMHEELLRAMHRV